MLKYNPRTGIFEEEIFRYNSQTGLFEKNSLSGFPQDGTISVTSSFSSPVSIWVDDVHKGRTPLRINITEGRHKVYAAQLGLSKTYFVDVRRGITTYLKVELSLSDQHNLHHTSNSSTETTSSKSNGCIWSIIAIVIFALLVCWIYL